MNKEVGLGLLLVMIGQAGSVLKDIDVRQNLWVTWANQTRSNSFCLALASASDPFQTCLIGIPSFDSKSFTGYSTAQCNSGNASYCTADLLSKLNKTLPWDPQELDLVGSRPLAQNETGCVFFGNYRLEVNTPAVWLTPKHADFANATRQCGPGKTYGWGRAHTHIWTNQSAMALPNNIFLICGDRAWHGIPKNAYGGPCYLGKLTLLAPNMTMIKMWKDKLMQSRSKREISQLDPNCKDNVELWGEAARFFASALAPGVAVAHALTTLGKLACWTVKQSNVTTAIIENLASDLDSLRHSVLQNRAATDFLLLAHGHGCEDFEGMCCFNLSNHGESVQKQLQWLKQHTQKIATVTSPLDEWLASLGVGPWLMSIAKISIILGIGFLLLVLCVPCVCMCLQSMMQRMMQNMLDYQLLAQVKENGGTVENLAEEWLKSKGHDQIKLVKA